jgi:Mg-chelatase subunit ChlD
VHEGAAAEQAVAQASKRTTSRRELARHDRFEQISPEVGEIDPEAVEQAMADDPDATLALLADMTSATDRRLAELARRLAGRLALDLVRVGGAAPRRAVGRLATRPWRGDGGDLDVEASLDEVVDARATSRAVDPHELKVRTWARPTLAVALCVDRSGSMGGAPLAAAALAAAAVAFRAPDDASVLAFGSEVVVVRSQDAPRPVESVVRDVLALRGHGTTDVAGVLRVAAEQLRRSSATRKVAVLMSDCRATVPGDVEAAARDLDELLILAPATDDDEARRLAGSVGARLVTLDPEAPSTVPERLALLFDPAG